MRDMLKQDGLNRQKHKYDRAAKQRMNGGKVDGDTRAAFLSRSSEKPTHNSPFKNKVQNGHQAAREREDCALQHCVLHHRFEISRGAKELAEPPCTERTQHETPHNKVIGSQRKLVLSKIKLRRSPHPHSHI